MKRQSLLLTLAASLVIVLSGVLLAGDSDQGGISGRVYDIANGRALPDVWVAASDSHQGMYTDSLGSFTLEPLPAGTYTLVVALGGYELADGGSTLVVEVAAGKTTDVGIGLARVQGEETKTNSRQDVDKSISLMAPSCGASLPSEVLSDTRDKKSGVCAESEAGMGFARKERSSDHTAPADAYKCLPYTGGVLRPEDPYPPRDMYFRDYGTNGFVETRHDRFSTFAVDVDDASYTLVRRYLQEGNMPPTDAVRVEEFINHFDYGYQNPSDSRFRVFSELTDSPFDDHVSILKIGIKGREAAACRRKPLNLTLVMDVSGSMGYDNRMELVKQSLRLLVDGLDRSDQVGIVAYNTSAWTLLNPVAGNARSDAYRAIEQLHPGGSTNAEAGLTLGYQIADRQYVYGHNNVVILCSDGVANVGETGPDGIMSRIKRLVDQGITLSTFGFGMGNYNDVLLEQLAQQGNGRYAYVNDLDEARRVFVDNLVANTQILARDVKIQVEFDSRSVQSYRLLGYENRDVADNRFRDNNQDGGEIGAGHEVTAIYELVLTGARGCDKLATVFVRAKDADQTDVAEHSYEVLKGRDYQSFDRSRPELRLAIAASRFADLLRGAEECGPGQYEQLYRIAQRVSRELPSEQTAELANLIRMVADRSTSQARGNYEDDGYANYKNYKK